MICALYTWRRKHRNPCDMGVLWYMWCTAMPAEYVSPMPAWVPNGWLRVHGDGNFLEVPDDEPNDYDVNAIGLVSFSSKQVKR